MRIRNLFLAGPFVLGVYGSVSTSCLAQSFSPAESLEEPQTAEALPVVSDSDVSSFTSISVHPSATPIDTPPESELLPTSERTADISVPIVEPTPVTIFAEDHPESTDVTSVNNSVSVLNLDSPNNEVGICSLPATYTETDLPSVNFASSSESFASERSWTALTARQSSSTGTMLFRSHPQCDPLANFTQLPLYARCSLSNGYITPVRQPDGSYAAGCVCSMNRTTTSGNTIVSNVPFDPNTQFCTRDGFLRGEARLRGIRDVIAHLQLTLAEESVRLPSGGILTANGEITMERWRDTRRIYHAAHVLGAACHMNRFSNPECDANRRGYCCQDFSRCAADCLAGHGAVGTGVLDFLCPGPDGHRITTIGFWGTRDQIVNGRPQSVPVLVNCLFEPQFSEIIGCYDMAVSPEQRRVALARIISEYYTKKKIPAYGKCSPSNLRHEFHSSNTPIFPRCCLYRKSDEMGNTNEVIYWPGQLGDPLTLCPATLNGYTLSGRALCSPDTPTLPSAASVRMTPLSR